jgi:hypothetical protein
MPSKKKTGRAKLPFLLLEPVVGVEPTTCCLRNDSSRFGRLSTKPFAALEYETLPYSYG